MKKLFLCIGLLCASTYAEETVEREEEATQEINSYDDKSGVIEETGYNEDCETAVEDEYWCRNRARREIFTQKFVEGIEKKDIEKLKLLVREIRKENILIYADNLIPTIQKNLYNLKKMVPLFGFCGISIFYSFYEIKKLQPGKKALFLFFAKQMFSSAALRASVFLLFRKDYQIINLLLQESVFIKFTKDILLLERMRRTCCPLFYNEQELEENNSWYLENYE